MAIPGFQELFESRIKNYFVCTSPWLGGNEIVFGLVATYESRRTYKIVFDT